ncbi:MAG: hypothetical protein QM756_43220 [Polyangiaceae bacterium]
MVFRVHLNSSYDANAGPDVKLFPDDSSDERTLSTKRLDAEGVVKLLWRDGFVPEWVDVMVVGLTDTSTILDVASCGRFAEDEAELYYAQTGVAPFSAKGPVLSANHVDGVRFSIYDRSSCWSADDLALVQQNASKVWSLELHGPEFDGLALGLASFPRLEILELFGVRVAGPELSALERMPQLRHLRARFAASTSFDLSALPTIRKLQTLELRNLPKTLLGAEQVAHRLPGLEHLTLSGNHPIALNGTVRLPDLQDLTLELPDVPRGLELPITLRRLSLHVPGATDDDLRAVLAACSPRLTHLGLRGTAASDALLADLGRFSGLAYLDAVDTGITEDALRRFVDRRPGFRCLPNLKL